MSSVEYSIAVENPNTHLFAITINYMPNTAHSDEVYLPNWIPGSYMIRDFAKHILDLQASDENGPLAIKPTAKNRFDIKHNQRPVTITYHYYAFDLSVRKAYLDQEFGFINPASSCLAIKGLEQANCLVNILQPSYPVTSKWQPATGMKATEGTTTFDWGKYLANNYIAFTEYPILFGQLDIASFEINNIDHHMVTVGQHFGDLKRVVKDLKPICQTQFDIFGEFPEDVDQYLFLTMITDNGFGGLEHTNSTALVASRNDIIRMDADLNLGYQTFLSLCSHEYFHTWNVKKLKPKEFIPYRLDDEVYTEQLWFYEGMTSYFDDLSLVTTGTIEPTDYLNALAKTLTRIERGHGQLRQSVVESSFLTWTKFYQQDETAPDQIVSYYLKGAIIACYADLSIRHQSNGSQSLKDIMRTAWLKFGRDEIGTTQKDLEGLFHTFMSEEHFEVFVELLHGKSKADLTELFADFGLTLNYTNQTSQSQWHVDSSEKKSAEDTVNQKSRAEKPWLGATLAKENNAIIVKQVLFGSPAERAGLAKGDQLVAFNQHKIINEDITSLLQTVATAKGNLLHYFRKDRLLCQELAIESSPNFVASFTIEDKAKLKAWLEH